MPVYLVRHTKAGSRSTWRGKDEERPLSSTGKAQAERLGKWLAKQPVTRMVASPYVRCLATLGPAADRLGLKVEALDVLAEGEPIEPVLNLLDELPDHAALCSHGDILTGTIGALIARGLDAPSKLDFRKGTVWVLERRKGQWATAKALPPR